MMDRRKFFGVFAGIAAVVVAVPAAAWRLLPRPETGKVFYCTTWISGTNAHAAHTVNHTMWGQAVWIDDTGVIEINIDDPCIACAGAALRIAADSGEGWAFRWIENERGVRLGEVRREVSYRADRDYWVVISQASVVS